MVNLTDLSIIQHGNNQEDQIVDSYDLITGIIIDFDGLADFKIKPDTMLPLIKGDPQHLKLLFKGFINKAIELFNGLIGEINIIHIKDPKSWIFAFFTEGFQDKPLENSKTPLIETISEFNLAISKRPTQEQGFILFF